MAQNCLALLFTAFLETTQLSGPLHNNSLDFLTTDTKLEIDYTVRAILDEDQIVQCYLMHANSLELDARSGRSDVEIDSTPAPCTRNACT